MERIAYDNNQQVPSWLWMACSGGITFMNIEIGLVSWVDGLAFDNERDSVALIADVGKFRNCNLTLDGDRYTISNFFRSREGWI